ncbi:MAG: TIGR03621 family F420-dependent LLM class oxidoreductase [Acidimicrobiales bacterium]
MTTRFRFGVSAGTVTDPVELVDLGRRAEELGFATFGLPDHLDEQCGPLVGLTAVAAATERIRLTTLVLAADYRNPAVLAKELATLDRFSGGRLEWGIGAGWKTADYERAGIPLDPPGVRIDRLAETIRVIRSCFVGDEFSFEGTHHRVAGLTGMPRPTGMPPLLVGGGAPRILRLAATQADIVGLNFSLAAGEFTTAAGSTGTAARTDEKVALVRAAAGDRFAHLELQTRLHAVFPTEDRDDFIEAMAPGFGLTPDEAREIPHALIGTPEEMCADIERWRQRWGISYLTCSATDMETLAPVVERLAGT